MHWELSHSCDDRARPLADRHYSRQKPGTPRFVPPGRCLTLLGRERRALWVTSWPYAEYVKHEWAGAWICSLFRNEGEALASDLIREAVAATRWRYGAPPDLGLVTFVDPAQVRHKRDPGRCFLRAGFEPCGMTKGGLLAFRMRPERIPAAEAPWRPAVQLALVASDMPGLVAPGGGGEPW